MFLYQLLSNVENTPNFLEFCVLVDFRIRQEIPAFIDEAKNNLNVNTLVLYESIGKVALIADNPSTFPNFERSYPCIDGLCIPCVWILVSMQQVSLCLVDFRHSSLEFDPFATVPGGLENLLLSTHLRIFDFRFRITLLPVSWCLADSFSFIVIHRIDSISRTWWRSFLLALAVHHQIQRCCFCCRWATVRGCFPSSFRHGTNHNVLSNLWERTLENGCKNTSRNTLHWTNTAGDSIHFSRNFLWSECPRFGFCFQQIWFGFLVPNWFCQTNNQPRATLWVFDTCLTVRLRPLINILITASLSSKMYNWDSPWEECVLVGTWSTSLNWSTSCRLLTFWVLALEWWLVCFGWTLLLVERHTSITECQRSSQRSRADNPSIRNPASREMISDSMELWETAVCFLHIQVTGTNVLLPKVHKTPPEVDLESWRSPAKSEAWNKPSQQCCAVCPTWQHCRKSFVWWNVRNQPSQASVTPSCDWSRKLVVWPQYVRSSNACQIQTC